MSDLHALVKRALPYIGGTHTIEDIEAMVETGSVQRWDGAESVMLTRIAQSPQKRELICFLAAGNLSEIKRLYHIVIDWGKAQGCDRAVFAGRPGWSRTFLTRDEGWKVEQYLYSKEF